MTPFSSQKPCTRQVRGQHEEVFCHGLLVPDLANLASHLGTDNSMANLASHVKRWDEI